MFRAPQLVDELVQGVDWQLPAQHLHLGQQVLLQPFHTLQDTRSMGVSLWGAQEACGGRRVRGVTSQVT